MPSPSLRPDLDLWQKQELGAIWIGHATVLLRIGGLNVLTDPVFSPRVGVGLGLVTGGPLRQIAPALALRQLPKLDLILVSHAHFDHLDRPTLARLPKSIQVITAPHNQDLIRDLGYKSVTELQWGQHVHFNGLRVTAQEVKHWGARTFYDAHRGYCAFLLEAGRRRVLYGGDTAYGEHFRSVGPVDLACLGIGAYNPYVAAHATPEQAVQMADDVKASFVLPMHHSTFRLSHEPMHEPFERFMEAIGKDGDRVAVRAVGGQWGVH